MHLATFALALLLASAASLPGQTFGEMTGEVRDPSAGMVAGAVVTVTNQATGAVRTVSKRIITDTARRNVSIELME